MVGGATALLGRRRAAAGAAVLAALLAYYVWQDALPRLGLWGDIAVIAVVLIPAVFALVWFVLPLRQAAGLIAAAAIAVALALVLNFAHAPIPANFVKLAATTAVAFWFLGWFESVTWVALVALIIPWVDAYSVWRGPTHHIVKHQQHLFSALSFALYLPNLYRATASALVERPVSEQFVRTAVTGELEGRLHVIKQEILSRARLSDLITRYNLYPELRRGKDMDSALDQMRRDILVEPSGPEQLSGKTKTVAFTVSYTSRDREKVADIANTIANFYVSQNDAIRSQEAVKTTQFLKQQLDEAKGQLDAQEAKRRATG